jgi:hypothetical protein
MSVPPRRPWLSPTIALGLALILAGCDQPTGSTTPRARAKPPEEVAEAPAPEPAPPAPAPAPVAPPVGPRKILNERTQDVRDAEKEKKAGGVAKEPRITAKDPILLTGNAYVSIVSQAASQNIKHALDLYQAETGEFPKTYEEFMEKIIKANNIALPKLPFYQEYAYDAPNHKLIVMEYPDRKEAANYPK